MTQQTSTDGVARFGPYEVNLRSGEVRKFGLRIKMGEQPLRILVLLMERQGELVTREELRTQLWSEDTFVDFDHSLNSAVQRLRECLSETAGKGQWIETVPRRGYRFAGAVEWVKPNGTGPVEATTPRTEADPGPGLIPRPAAAGTSLPKKGGTLVYRWRFALAFLVLLAIVALGVRVIRNRNKGVQAGVIRSMAVLPLENLSGDKTQDYFVDGMTDELITALAKNHSLRVISRTSVMQYKGVHRPLREIAHELGVDGILEGSVTRSGNRVHLTVQLVQATNETHLWAESYDRDLNEALALPTELSQTIAKEVRAAVSSSGPQRYVNPEAHDAYLRGRYSWFSENEDGSVAYFQQAIRLQPDYAAAWSGLADYYGGRAVEGKDPPALFRSNWEANARKAVALDENLADAHNSMAAWYFFGEWDLKRAEAESLRAIALNPNYAEAYHVYSYELAAMNRNAEAVEAQRHGIEIDPFSRPWALGYTYFHLRQFDAAVTELRLRTQADPRQGTNHMILSDAYHFAGMDKEAVAEMGEAYRLWGNASEADSIRREGAKGYLAVAKWQFRRDQAAVPKHYVSPVRAAVGAARAQEKEDALRLLEQGYDEHSPRLIFLQNEPEFDFLHSEPRYQELVRKMGLPTQ